MKRTKSMIYKETPESRELYFYAINEGPLYRRMTTPLIVNLKKKAEKGIYDKEKAVDAFYSIACEAAKRYGVEYGGSFSVQNRFSAAVDMEAYYKANEIFCGKEHRK